MTLAKAIRNLATNSQEDDAINSISTRMTTLEETITGMNKKLDSMSALNDKVNMLLKAIADSEQKK